MSGLELLVMWAAVPRIQWVPADSSPPTVPMQHSRGRRTPQRRSGEITQLNTTEVLKLNGTNSTFPSPAPALHPTKENSSVIFKEHKSGSRINMDHQFWDSHSRDLKRLWLWEWPRGEMRQIWQQKAWEAPAMVCCASDKDSNALNQAPPYTEKPQQQSRLDFFSGCYGHRIITVTIAIKAESSASMLP